MAIRFCRREGGCVRMDKKQKRQVPTKSVNVNITGCKKCMRKIKKIKNGLRELRDLMKEISELKKEL